MTKLQKMELFWNRMEEDIKGTYLSDERTSQDDIPVLSESDLIQRKMTFDKTLTAVKKGINQANRELSMYAAKTSRERLRWQNWACRVRLKGYEEKDIQAVFSLRYKGVI